MGKRAGVMVRGTPARLQCAEEFLFDRGAGLDFFWHMVPKRISLSGARPPGKHSGPAGNQGGGPDLEIEGAVPDPSSAIFQRPCSTLETPLQGLGPLDTV